MAEKKSKLIANFREIPNIQKTWRWFLITGILFVVLGFLSIGYSSWATVFTVEFFGFLLGAAGIVHLVNVFYTHQWTGFSLSLLLGLLYIIAGAFCIFKPMQSAMGITLLVGLVLVVSGAFRLISAPVHRYEHWKWVACHGLIAFILGLMILVEWPASSLWVIGVFIGVDLILIGSSWIYVSLKTKKD